MKKWIAILLAVFISLSLYGCTTKTPTTSSSEIQSDIPSENGSESYKGTDTILKITKADNSTETISAVDLIQKGNFNNAFFYLQYYFRDVVVEGCVQSVSTTPFAEHLTISLARNAEDSCTCKLLLGNSENAKKAAELLPGMKICATGRVGELSAGALEIDCEGGFDILS